METLPNLICGKFTVGGKDNLPPHKLKCCKFADPDQAYKDFMAAQQSEDKRIKIELVPADEARKALRIAVFE